MTAKPTVITRPTLRTLSSNAAASMVRRLASRGSELESLEPQVARIIHDVRRNGDKALHRYAQQWDRLAPKQALRVSEQELAAASASISPELRRALQKAAANIRRFAQWQKPRSFTRTSFGSSLGQIALPLDSVGCYVPGGRYPLVSTLLMTVIPAQVAGVEHIRVASPNPSPEVLAAASILDVKQFYRVGGAQAIAAFAYGTLTIPKVEKIVGPGNSYVTVAKKLVSFDCSIDFLAGPTEALILSEDGDPDFIAADLVSQAEHDPASSVAFITTKSSLAASVAACVARRAAPNPVALQSLRRNSAILIASSRDEARAWANQIASEHLTIDPDDLPHIRNAGSIFIGDYSPQSAGDYASGPNHVLPTSGQARFRGGLSVLDFVKVVTVQQLSQSGLQKIARTVDLLARTEGLAAHAESIEARVSRTESKSRSAHA